MHEPDSIDIENKKNIAKIVITGGPCAGKSTAISRIEEKLSQKGYKVLVINETATEIITGGIFWGEKGLNSFDFHSLILKLQIKKEEIFADAALKMPCENIVILYDRGAIDVKAYSGKERFTRILDSLALSEISLRDSYDAVFHLKTAAAGAEEFYTLENNVARSETPQEAREIDLATINAWTGHSNLRIIDNSTDFNLKINRLLVEIFCFLGLPATIEIEREYLTKMPDIEQLIKRYNAEKINIIQTYLISPDKDEEKRIRQRGREGEYSYFLTNKRIINNISRVETEKRISFEEYSDLLMTADTSLNQIKKERYCFVYNNIYFELDVYPFWSDYAILEVELTTENQKVDFPPFLTILKEVTDDPIFRDYALSRKIPDIF